ncbi:MAG: ABC transporter permease subunit [Actinophytocola sp.]|nr:ABC transporter permease subunit [Actinophytocola sp.]
MGKLIKAEFRKILTTKLWWGLLIVALLVAGGWAGLLSSAFDGIAEEIQRSDLTQRAGIDLADISFSVVFLARAINIATIFPMLFGGLAIASELGRKTITTSFLTAPNRTMLLGAKAITYVIWGAIYGVAITLAATLGIVIGTGGDHLVGVTTWLSTAAAGLLSCVLWTLLGLGVGALIGSPVGTVIVLLVYGLAIGPLSDLVLTGFAGGNANLAGALPNGAANGLTGSTAADTLAAEIEANAGGLSVLPGDLVERFQDTARLAAGGLGSYGLLASAAIFFGWAMLFFALGVVRTRARDIT